MILADKIIKLRKQNGWSQEELALRLNVSRQAISKWESTASIPDMDRILKMSTLFGVSTDYLLKDDHDDIEYTESDDSLPLRKITLDEANAYLNFMRVSSKQVALGVFLCILSPTLLLLLNQMVVFGQMGDMNAVVFGLVFLFPMVLLAVLMFVNFGVKRSKYTYLETDAFELEYGVFGVVEKYNERNEEHFRKQLLLSMALLFIAVAQVVIGALLDTDIILLLVVFLLILVAFAVYGLVHDGLLKDSYQKLLQENDYTIHSKQVKRKYEGFEALYWCVVVALYLGLSFISMQWNRTWLIWPVAGVIFGGIQSFLNSKGS